MLTSHEIRRRIRSIGNTGQLTKAMQMVAASKMRKAQQAALRGHPFVRLLYRMQRTATTHAVDFSHPLMAVREVRRRAVIVVSADKGLCGALNSNVLRLATQFDPHSTVFIAAGRRAANFIARSGRQLIAEFTYSDTPRFSEARAVAAFTRDLFLKAEVDQVQVVTTHFVNTLTQRPVCLEFLPVGEIREFKMEGLDSEEESTARIPEFRFEPSPAAFLGYLLGHYLNIYLFQVLLDAKASEQSARMVSMKSATENADRLIKELTLEYNKLRQDNITKELLDIAGGQAESN